MKRQSGKPKLPRGKMPPGTRVHKDRKKEANKNEKKWRGVCEPPEVCSTCPEYRTCSHLHGGDDLYLGLGL